MRLWLADKKMTWFDVSVTIHKKEESVQKYGGSKGQRPIY